MATPVVMPKLGMSMQEGRVVAWAVPPGGAVERGRPVVVIESEKAEVELEATASGVLRHLYVSIDETVRCGTLLAAIAGADEPFDAEAFRRAHERAERAPAPDAARTPPAPASRAPVAPPAPPAPGTAPRVAVAPAARARARALGVDPARLAGSGPGGRVVREDVEAWAARTVPVAPGVRLEVLEQGAGAPVLLLPGFGSDVAVFARQAPVLASRWRVLAVNPRGVALSSSPEAERYDVAELAADAAAVCAARAGAGPAHVIGASLGAAVALELALAAPGRVRSLVLVTPFLAAPPRLVAVLDAWCRLAREVAPETLAHALVPWLFGATSLADERARARNARGLAEIAARVPAATLARQAAGLRAWSARGDALARVAAPTLVVAGEEDLLVPDAAAVAEAIPGAALRRVPGAGHAVALEAPEVVNHAILAHLERATGSGAS
jgi:pyruvate dehydrogenase E2 component (dihydrolipoamide acetyltransferase)